jgi:hypothetical protein
LVIVIILAPDGPVAVTLAESITAPIPSISYNAKDNGVMAGENVNVIINDCVAGLLKTGAYRKEQKEAQVVPAPACGVAICFAGELEGRPAVYPETFIETVMPGLPITPKFVFIEPVVYETAFQLKSCALARQKIQTRKNIFNAIFGFIQYRFIKNGFLQELLDDIAILVNVITVSFYFLRKIGSGWGFAA